MDNIAQAVVHSLEPFLPNLRKFVGAPRSMVLSSSWQVIPKYCTRDLEYTGCAFADRVMIHLAMKRSISRQQLASCQRADPSTQMPCVSWALRVWLNCLG